MLELRPNCEYCNRDLPPDATEARICSYECTFCADCVERVLRNVCPNCGGGFVPRPIRPKAEYRTGTGLAHHPPSTRQVKSKYQCQEIAEFSSGIVETPPDQR